MAVAVDICDSCRCLPETEDILRQVGLMPGALRGGSARWRLEMRNDALCLVEKGECRHKPLLVDFVKIRKQYRSLPIARRGPMVRAVGRSTRQVVDATAGWGGDMFLMWLMGYEVRALERSPVVAALLLDGLYRFNRYEPEPASPEIVVGDAVELLAGHPAECVYLDPMFPPRRKTSALASRPLRSLRDLVGSDDDRVRLFDAAWQAATRRVVVKRPNHAGPWRVPNESFVGKLITYDLYLK